MNYTRVILGLIKITNRLLMIVNVNQHLTDARNMAAGAVAAIVSTAR